MNFEDRLNNVLSEAGWLDRWRTPAKKPGSKVVERGARKSTRPVIPGEKERYQKANDEYYDNLGKAIASLNKVADLDKNFLRRIASEGYESIEELVNTFKGILERRGTD